MAYANGIAQGEKYSLSVSDNKQQSNEMLGGPRKKDLSIEINFSDEQILIMPRQKGVKLFTQALVLSLFIE